MIKIKPKCVTCEKEIEGNDVVYVKIRYPEWRGFTEIKAYIRNEGEIICEDCFQNK